MTVSIILTSHMKPTLGDAIESVLGQTRSDWECVVMDSGAWIDGGDSPTEMMRALQMRAIVERYNPLSGSYERAKRLSRFLWNGTGEPPDLRAHKCPVSWATNEAIRRGLVRGEYVCHFYDDDIMYPTIIETAGFLDAHPEEKAVLCAQDLEPWLIQKTSPIAWRFSKA